MSSSQEANRWLRWPVVMKFAILTSIKSKETNYAIYSTS